MVIEKELRKTREAAMFKKFNELWVKGWKAVQFTLIISTWVGCVYVC